ncbi:hypothetical protein KFE25_011485 [Diacronema lutheri]|uniref:Uncharacterized protein n=2 Tax=Diacronema lutheri TaxID=2081491 RepID=A0A8J5XDH2_DIALT|nr:hypothetical protein KFE25_011485 [Diacronema lutheri]
MIPLLLLGLLDARAALHSHRAPCATTRPARPARSARSAARPAMSLSRHDRIFDKFLLQRAVQTQIYYLNELHDQPSARFIANFLDHQGIDTYHGFDGLRVDAEDYIQKLLESPPTTVQVRSSWGSVSWGGSPGNPHLSQHASATHDFVVYPDRIGAALLRVRDQIADEVSADLDVLAGCDADFWRQRESGAAHATLADGSSTAESSPTRRATFDLLQKLTLHVAVKQTLLVLSRERRGGLAPGSGGASGGGGGEPSARHAWLERKFAQSGFLCGDQGFGTSRLFLDSLAAHGAVVVRPDISADLDGARAEARTDGCTIVDPREIANQILDVRMLLAKHFKGRLEGVHARGTDQLRNRLERSLRAKF